MRPVPELVEGAEGGKWNFNFVSLRGDMLVLTIYLTVHKYPYKTILYPLRGIGSIFFNISTKLYPLRGREFGEVVVLQHHIFICDVN